MLPIYRFLMGLERLHSHSERRKKEETLDINYRIEEKQYSPLAECAEALRLVNIKEGHVYLTEFE